MSDLNSIEISGRLVRDPELMYTPSGTALLKFRIASDHTYKKGEQERKDVLFINVIMWGERAEEIQPTLEKGKGVRVQGRLTYRECESAEGRKVHDHEIRAFEVE